MARKSKTTGLWILEPCDAQYMAWREWLFREDFWERAGFEPPKIVVPLEWPPETVAAAAAVADHFRELRGAASKDKGCPPMRTVPLAPQPWTRWPWEECKRREAQFREAENPSVDSATADRRLGILRTLANSLRVNRR